MNEITSLKSNLQLRLKIRDDVLSKLDTDIEYIIDLFINYQLDYFSVLQILSTIQYLRICKKALSLPVTKPEHIAYINYSILSLSLEAPITCQEYNDAVLSLKSLERSKVPHFLHQEIDEFFDLIYNKNEMNDQTIEPNQEEEPLNIDIQHISPQIDMTALFDTKPIDHDLIINSINLHKGLLSNAGSDILVSQLSSATNNFNDFSTILNYFSYQIDGFQKFTDFILAILYKSYQADSKNTENISMFKKQFAIQKASLYFMEICSIVTKDYIDGNIPIQYFHPNFDKVLSAILNLCSEFTNDTNYHILAATQLSLTEIKESIAHFALAASYSYTRSKEINDTLAAFGIELLIQDANPKRRGYAAAFYQFTHDEAILTLLTKNTMKLTADDLFEAMPFFWNFEVLRLIMPDEREQREYLLAYSAKNIEEMDTIPGFRDFCIMRLLNALNKDFSVSNLNIFNVDKTETNK